MLPLGEGRFVSLKIGQVTGYVGRQLARVLDSELAGHPYTGFHYESVERLRAGGFIEPAERAGLFGVEHGWKLTDKGRAACEDWLARPVRRKRKR